MNKVFGKVEAVFFTRDDTFKIKVSDIKDSITSDFDGIIGDGHVGRTKMTKGYREQEVFGIGRPEGRVKVEVMNWRHWSAVSIDELSIIAEKIGLTKFDPIELASLLGANILISGIEKFTQITIGSLIVFPSGCTWKVESENYPCVTPGIEINRVYPNINAAHFPKLAWNLRGLVGTVFKAGEIKNGDILEIYVR